MFDLPSKSSPNAVAIQALELMIMVTNTEHMTYMPNISLQTANVEDISLLIYRIEILIQNKNQEILPKNRIQD